MLITFTPVQTKMEEEEEEEAHEEEKEERRQLVCETIDPKARSTASSFLWRGLRLGKKVAIAGAAITTAPVVIPPLIVGLAFAFPFDVYFAGFTYTDKVMRALLSTPRDIVMPDDRDDEEEEKERDIEIWPPTATLDITQKEEEGERGEIETEMPPRIDHSLAAVERTGNDLEIETWARQMIVISGDDEVPGGLVEGGEAKKETASTEKGHDEVDRDEPALVTAEHNIELWPPTSNLDIPREEVNNIEGPGTGDESRVEEVRDRMLGNYNTEQDANIKFDYSSPINRKEDMFRDIGTLGEEKQMQVERGAKHNEERRDREEKENKNGIINEHEIGISDHPFIIDDYKHTASGNMEVGEGPIESTGKEETNKSEEGDEILGLATAVPKAKKYPKITSPYAALMPKESDIEMKRTIFSSKYAPPVENGKEMAAYEVKESEMMFDGRAEGIEDDVLPPYETKEHVHHALASAPEELEVDFKLPNLNTEHALPASGISESGTEAVEAKIMKGVGTKEMNETDEVEMNRQDVMGQIESNYVVTTVVSLECNHVVEQSAVDQNRIERGVETLGEAVESEKDEGGVMGERNTGNGRSVATPEENVIAVYHSFVSVAPLESETERVPSSLSTEYASAVEDQSTDMTDTESGPTTIIVETAGIVHFDNEVLYSEEMIWEQIYAMQTIVGYKSALNSSLVEELKALYLFTGVDPPISLGDTSDVMEIGDKLDFLKSVIGVK